MEAAALGSPRPAGRRLGSWSLRGDSEGSCLWREGGTVSEIRQDLLKMNKRKTSSPGESCQRYTGVCGPGGMEWTDGPRVPAPAATWAQEPRTWPPPVPSGLCWRQLIVAPRQGHGNCPVPHRLNPPGQEDTGSSLQGTNACLLDPSAGKAWSQADSDDGAS